MIAEQVYLGSPLLRVDGMVSLMLHPINNRRKDSSGILLGDFEYYSCCP